MIIETSLKLEIDRDVFTLKERHCQVKLKVKMNNRSTVSATTTPQSQVCFSKLRMRVFMLLRVGRLSVTSHPKLILLLLHIIIICFVGVYIGGETLWEGAGGVHLHPLERKL